MATPRPLRGLLRARATTGAALLAVLVLVPAGPAVAATAGEGEPVGGPRLGTDAVVTPAGAPALPAPLSAASWLVADLDTGEVLGAKDAHGQYAPASTLKTLTALTLIPLLPADRKVVPTYDDIAVDGSKVGLVERVGYPVKELLEALLMVSGNDAANALASAAGGQEATARLMNERARQLHAFDTHAVNPHGLDAPGQVSSAYDLALIARAGMADPAFATYVATRTSTVSAPGSARMDISNKNKLLYHYEGALGIKNGYTSTARASFVGAAERDGRRLVVALMRADPKVWEEAGRLLDWGFAAAAAGVSPVGELVSGEAPAHPVPAEVPEGMAESAVEGVLAAPASDLEPAAGEQEDGGVSAPMALTGTSLIVVALLVHRRRQVVAARNARRRAARQAAAGARPAPARPAACAPARPVGAPRRSRPLPDLSPDRWASAPQDQVAQRAQDVDADGREPQAHDAGADLGGPAGRRLTS